MIDRSPTAEGHLRVVANVEGEVEIRVRPGQMVYGGQILAIVEGDKQLESHASRSDAEIVEILVATGAEVPRGTLLMTILPAAEE
jgi:biotin carboxyl carrier protein